VASSVSSGILTDVDESEDLGSPLSQQTGPYQQPVGQSRPASPTNLVAFKTEQVRWFDQIAHPQTAPKTAYLGLAGHHRRSGTKEATDERTGLAGYHQPSLVSPATIGETGLSLAKAGSQRRKYKQKGQTGI